MKKIIFNLIGVLIFVIVLFSIDLAQTLSIISSVSIWNFLGASALIIPFFIAKVMRWRSLLKMQGVDFKFKDAFLMYFSAFYIGVITPGRVGELAKLFYVKKEGYSTGKALFSVIVDRLFDLFWLLGFGYIGLFFFGTVMSRHIYYLSLIIGVFFASIVLFYFNKIMFKRLASFVFKIFVPERFKEKIKLNVVEFYEEIFKLKFSTVMMLSALTAFSWLFYYSQMFILAKAIGLDISFFFLAVCLTIAGLVALIPISIDGVGTRDVTLIFLFSFFGISSESAVAMSLLVLIMALVSALIGLVCWFKKPIDFSSSSQA